MKAELEQRSWVNEAGEMRSSAELKSWLNCTSGRWLLFPFSVKQCLATLNILLIQRLQNSMLMSLTETEVLQTGQTGATSLITVCMYIFVQMICIFETDMLSKPTYKQVLIGPLQTQRISHWPKQVKCKNWVQGQDMFFSTSSETKSPQE